MPDPVIYLKALTTSAIVSGFLMMAGCLASRQVSSRLVGSVGVLSASVGIVAGLWQMPFSLPWPPSNAINRFLGLILPALVFIELCLSACHDENRISWILRFALSVITAPLLVYGSVYLNSSRTSDCWSPMEAFGVFIVCCGLLFAVWRMMTELSKRSAPESAVMGVSMALMAAGMVTMLRGYIKGGSAAFPIVVSMTATTSVAFMFRRICSPYRQRLISHYMSIGVVSLFCVLFIGRYFGKVSSSVAVVVFLTPLLCWGSELKRFRVWPAWKIMIIRLGTVSIPLGLVLAIEYFEFNRKMAPLLVNTGFVVMIRPSDPGLK